LPEEYPQAAVIDLMHVKNPGNLQWSAKPAIIGISGVVAAANGRSPGGLQASAHCKGPIIRAFFPFPEVPVTLSWIQSLADTLRSGC
jgi:hypothetical protein